MGKAAAWLKGYAIKDMKERPREPVRVGFAAVLDDEQELPHLRRALADDSPTVTVANGEAVRRFEHRYGANASVEAVDPEARVRLSDKVLSELLMEIERELALYPDPRLLTDLTLIPNTGANDYDGWQDTWLAEFIIQADPEKER